MSQVNQILHGVIRGRTIELAEDAGLPDGQQVAVVLQVEPPRESPRRTAAGMLADYPEMDRYLDEILGERKLSTIRELDE
ncbi:MAG: hypothetical protein K2Y37_03180 [Pirellulales bacterium]|nr:hypothetical protein [Pirellulales bacterium]